MYKAELKKHTFIFKTPGGTSRGVLHTKDSWHISLWNKEAPEIKGIGECSIIPKLSIDARPDLEAKLKEVIKSINTSGKADFKGIEEFPSIRFALETASIDLETGGQKTLFSSDFTKGKASIPINGLVWMGTPEFMQKQIEEKIAAGFSCIKLKIGAIDFDTELSLLKSIRKKYDEKTIELRVDANGAFTSKDVWFKLEELAKLKIHSIEQPVKAGQYELMEEICRNTPLPVALDEELIGVSGRKKKADLLNFIKPQYIILKPSLLGGFAMCEEWIKIAKETGTGWWVTSALEGNIGLNAISHWTYTMQNPMHQGLGTGQVFTNNIKSPLKIKNGALWYDPNEEW